MYIINGCFNIIHIHYLLIYFFKNLKFKTLHLGSGVFYLNQIVGDLDGEHEKSCI